MKFFLILFFLFHFCLYVKASNPRKERSFYISIHGNDNNIGSKNAPFKSIEKINTIDFIGGDSLLFESSQEFLGTLIIKGFKGNKPIYIGTTNEGKAIINGLNTKSIFIDSSQNIYLTNIFCKGNGRKEGNIDNGISIFHSTNITTKNCLVSGFQKIGIYIYCSKQIVIEKCITENNGAAGIQIDGESKKSSRNILIKSCKAINNPGDPTNLVNHSGNGILAGLCTKVLIDQCEAYENGWDMPRIGNGPVGIWTYESDSVVIQNCNSHHNKTSKGGSDGGGFDLDGGVTNAIIQNCTSYDNEGAGYGIYQYAGASLWNNNIIRNCTSTNDGLKSGGNAAIYIWNSSGDEEQFKNLKFYNNTIQNNNGVAIRFDILSKHQKFSFYRNIFKSKDSLIAFGALHEMDIFKNNNWTSFKHGKTKIDSAIMTQVVSRIKDQYGKRINAHGGSILLYKGIYYLYGELKSGNTWLVPNQSWECYRVPAEGISCYSSVDLKKWNFKGIVFNLTIGEQKSILDTGNVIERPRVLYNNRTKKFVMWMHIDKNDYSLAQVGVAVSEKPEGPFHFVSSFKPNNQDSRDMTLFKDTDGKAYLFNSSENNNSIHVNELTADYLQVKPNYTTILENQRRESPAVFKINKGYYLVTSLCTGWAPNEAIISFAKSPMGPWVKGFNPCLGTNSEITYGSQISYIQKDYKTNTWWGIADVWDKTNLKNSNYIWLPIKVLNKQISIIASTIY